MMLQIERMTSDVSISDTELSLTSSQIDKLVALVISRLEDRAREAQRARAATRVSHQASPPLGSDH
jgi:hypothetical protein